MIPGNHSFILFFALIVGDEKNVLSQVVSNVLVMIIIATNETGKFGEASRVKMSITLISCKRIKF